MRWIFNRAAREVRNISEGTHRAQQGKHALATYTAMLHLQLRKLATLRFWVSFL